MSITLYLPRTVGWESCYFQSCMDTNAHYFYFTRERLEYRCVSQQAANLKKPLHSCRRERNIIWFSTQPLSFFIFSLFSLCVTVFFIVSVRNIPTFSKNVTPYTLLDNHRRGDEQKAFKSQPEFVRILRFSIWPFLFLAFCSSYSWGVYFADTKLCPLFGHIFPSFDLFLFVSTAIQWAGMRKEKLLFFSN